MTPIDATAAPVAVRLLGFGTVGRAFAEALAADPRLGKRVRLVSVTDSQGSRVDPRGLDPRALLDEKARCGTIARHGDNAEDDGATVLVDLTPTDLRTGEPSRSVVVAALRRGLDVVTANKGPVALHAPDLAEASRDAGRRVRASATVCGGTPILELLGSAFHGDAVERIEGVLNGSTNLVLSLLEDGATWDEALARARSLGVLEADPSLDLLGLDAAAKAVILANHAWGSTLRLPDARVQGIFGVTPQEAKAAKAHGLALRLVARITPEGVSVAPVSLPREHPLVAEGTENVVRLKLRGAGTVTLRGPGAGGKETAAAVLSDVLALAPQARLQRLAAAPVP